MLNGATTVQIKLSANATQPIVARNGFPVSPRSLLAGALLAWLLILFAPPSSLLAQAIEPAVRYDITGNTIVVGAAYQSSTPAEAPFVGNPSHPAAPKYVLSIPQLANRLTALGQPGLLINQDNGVWLLKANLIIEQNTRLEATSSSIHALRIESVAPQPTQFVSAAELLVADFGFTASELASAPEYVTSSELISQSEPISPVNYLKVLVDGGSLVIDGIAVSSWDTAAGTVDNNIKDGRSYIAALRGARMDVRNAEVSHLGWTKREGAGLSWRIRAISNLAESASTGTVFQSKIHHNYYGLYVFDGSNMRIEKNQVSDNIYYGMLASRCTGMVISGNEFFDNRGHGLLLSRQCNDSTINDNQLYQNGWSGIALYRGADGNRVFHNQIFDNSKSGIVVFQSSGNQIYENQLRNNQQNGISVNAFYDPADTFDGLATDNVINANLIDASELGICLYARADRNTLTKNLITGQATAGIAVFTGGNQVVDNEVFKNGWGILVEGGEPLAFERGVVEPVAALDTPGHGNRLAGNTIEENVQGIVINAGADNLVGGLVDLPGVADDAGNKIRRNLEHGLYLSATHGTLIAHNIITDNMLTGLTVVGVGSERNRLTGNRITANGKAGIVLSAETNPSPAPHITNYSNGIVSGTVLLQGSATPGSQVEVYRDPNGQGRYPMGVAVANSIGSWTLIVSDTLHSKQGDFTALATDSAGNSSEFSAPFSLTAGGVQETLAAGSAANQTLIQANGINQSRLTQVQQECMSDLPDLTEGAREESGDIAVHSLVWLPLIVK